MSRGKRRSGTCIHCLEWHKEITHDHVIPRAWYPPETPPSVERWTAPSCLTCNQKHGENEGRLIALVGLTFEPDDPIYGHIAKLAIRAVSPKYGTTPKDIRSRESRRRKLFQSFERPDQVSPARIVPNFGRAAGIPDVGQPAFPIEPVLFQTFAIKLARGLAYRLDGHYIPTSYKVDYRHVEGPDPRSELFFSRYARGAENGAIIKVRWAHSLEDPSIRLYYVELFERWKWYVSVRPAD